LPLQGVILFLKTEASIKIQFFIGLLVIITGFYYNISLTEWMIQILAIGLVMSIEGLNTAIEKMADFIHPEHHNKIWIY
jgi:diacylglycerol kinase (ATP)